MYKFLKSRGVVNNKFFLRIYDKDLMNIDVHGIKHPDMYLKIKVARECHRNPWYYLREVCEIPVTGGSTRYELNRGNLALSYILLHNIDASIMMPRQNGKTIGALCLMSWVFWFANNHSDFIFSNKKLSDARNNVNRFKEISEMIPEWLKPKRDYHDKDSGMNYTCHRLKNGIAAIPSATSLEQADKLGRGMTVPIAYFDEFAFNLFNKTEYTSATMALSKAADVAESNHNYHFRIISTTPNSVDLPEGQFCKYIMDSACPFDEKIIYDLPETELKQYITDHSENDFVHIEFSWRQLGKDEAWYKKQCRALQHVKLAIKREVDLEWTLSGDKSPLDENELETIKKYIIDEDACTIVDTGYSGYKFITVGPIDPEKHVILACDCSGGLEQDRSVILALDAKTREAVGGFYSNRISTPAFRELITMVSINLYVNSVIVVERNSYGLTIIDEMAEDSRVRGKLFYMYKGHVNPNDTSSILDSSKVKIYGINTTPESRSYMMNSLFKYVSESPQLFKLPIIYKELKTLERKRNGKVEHADGEHDDTVLAFLIGQYAMDQPTMKYFLYRNYLKKNDEEPEKTIRTIKIHSSTDLYTPKKENPLKKYLLTSL